MSDDCLNSASTSKLKIQETTEESAALSSTELKGNRILDISILANIFTLLCCPVCFHSDLKLREDSKFGICSNFAIVCKCGYMEGFSSTPKEKSQNNINSLLVMGLRLIGKGFTSGKKLLFSLNLPFISKAAFRRHETKLLEAVQCASNENMTEAANDVNRLKNNSACGVSVDGTWQRRGHTSLNGCVSAISIDTGKVLDVELMSLYCRTCELNTTDDEHLCANHKGSSGSMEVVGAYRIFERSLCNRNLKYTEYYGDGDSKGYTSVKDVYGKDSVKKLECIGHVQKRVGARLRNLKKTKKGLGGKGKLTDKLIDKLQNYYGIAIRSNCGNIDSMQSAVIAAFFHCCSNKKNEMHRQCPTGSDSWCKYQRALHLGHRIPEESSGLPQSIINIIKPTYMALCDRQLLVKCLHGMTQNNNESFNSVLWSIIPKGTFVGLQTLLLGAHFAVLLFNSGYLGLLPVFEKLGIHLEPELVRNYWKIDSVRVSESQRRSLPAVKISRKKRKAARKSKSVKCETKEGFTYKCGQF